MSNYNIKPTAPPLNVYNECNQYSTESKTNFRQEGETIGNWEEQKKIFYTKPREYRRSDYIYPYYQPCYHEQVYYSLAQIEEKQKKKKKSFSKKCIDKLKIIGKKVKQILCWPFCCCACCAWCCMEFC